MGCCFGVDNWSCHPNLGGTYYTTSMTSIRESWRHARTQHLLCGGREYLKTLRKWSEIVLCRERIEPMKGTYNSFNEPGHKWEWTSSCTKVTLVLTSIANSATSESRPVSKERESKRERDTARERERERERERCNVARWWWRTTNVDTLSSKQPCCQQEIGYESLIYRPRGMSSEIDKHHDRCRSRRWKVGLSFYATDGWLVTYCNAHRTMPSMSCLPWLICTIQWQSLEILTWTVLLRSRIKRVAPAVSPRKYNVNRIH